MAPFVPRMHLLEINDQSWFPDFLRQRVQACLTLLWTFRVPFLQPCSPASLVAQTLLRILGDRSSDYTYVDFCSGAGGPTLAIEKEFNARLNAGLDSSASSRKKGNKGSDTSSSSGEDAAILTPQSSPSGSHVSIAQRRSKRIQTQDPSQRKGPKQAHFVLTDIAPHLAAWELAAEHSEQIRYVSSSIDASAAPSSLLSSVSPVPLPSFASRLPIFRLFSLAFHHFDEPLATKILANTLQTSSGFAILELQQRNISSQIMTILLFPLLVILTPIFFWKDPVQLLFSILLPVIPLVVSLDGMVSSLRTRTGEEVKAMVDKVLHEKGNKDMGEWDVLWGSEWHTWPIGEMSWVVGLKKPSGKA